MSAWREGARINDGDDRCPGCGRPGVLTYGFRKFGQHTFAHCPVCKALFVDGQKAADVKEGA